MSPINIILLGLFLGGNADILPGSEPGMKSTTVEPLEPAAALAANATARELVTKAIILEPVMKSTTVKPATALAAGNGVRKMKMSMAATALAVALTMLG
uniref:Secreted protein n=1 Tax=Globodera pallida TaxID=36090 RepID=A0A183BW97_GLOPA